MASTAISPGLGPASHPSAVGFGWVWNCSDPHRTYRPFWSSACALRSCSESLFLAIPSPKGAAVNSQGRQPLENGNEVLSPKGATEASAAPLGLRINFTFHGPGANAPGY